MPDRAELLAKLRVMRGSIGAILSAGELDMLMAEVDDRRCATCRWARPFESPDEWSASPEEIARMKKYPMECALAEMAGGHAVEPQTLAFTMDGSSYRASLMVAPEFGCIQHEAKA